MSSAQCSNNKINIYIQPIILKYGTKQGNKSSRQKPIHQHMVYPSPELAISSPCCASENKKTDCIPFPCGSNNGLINEKSDVWKSLSGSCSQLQAGAWSPSTISSTETRVKSFQMEQWMVKYRTLLVFLQEYGHSSVPNNYKNQSLVFWVKRQRQQYKLYKAGKPSYLNHARMELLNEIGFIWEAHQSSWNENIAALIEFHGEHQHCNVPISYKDRKLAIWVKRQRMYYKQYFEGKASNITPERIIQLEQIGFEWTLRRKN